MPRWFPIESNPDVINRYIASLGLSEPAVEVVDVYGVTEELLSMVPQPVYAVALVYPITENTEKALKRKTDEQSDDIEAFRKANSFFYTKQYVSNACGTIAILHALMNNYDRLGGVREGSVLAKYHGELLKMSPEECGRIIAEDSSLAEAHAEAADNGATRNQDIDTDIDLHFVTFVKVGQRCVELDGRQANPILHGECADEAEFLRAASAAIAERMAMVPDSLEFGITALVPLQ